MIRRVILSLVLVVAGFTAGLVLTGRMRTAADSRAEVPAAVSQPVALTRAAAPAPAPTDPTFSSLGAQHVLLYYDRGEVAP